MGAFGLMTRLNSGTMPVDCPGCKTYVVWFGRMKYVASKTMRLPGG